MGQAGTHIDDSTRNMPTMVYSSTPARSEVQIMIIPPPKLLSCRQGYRGGFTSSVIRVTFLRIRLLSSQAPAPQAGKRRCLKQKSKLSQAQIQRRAKPRACAWGILFRNRGEPVDRRMTPLSPEDQREFDRWLKANAIVGLIIAVGLLAMALAGLNSVGRPDSAVTDRPKSSDVATSK